MNDSFLDTLGQLPRTIVEARKLIGVRETLGAGSTPAIMAWMAELGEKTLGYRYTDDGVPWCGGFAAIVAKRAGKPVPVGPLYALNWSTFGERIASRVGLKVTNPLVTHVLPGASLGDVLVFRRTGGGHVGFYIGEDDATYCVLGGNQSDAVGYTWIEKSRCVAVRRPSYNLKPASVRPYRLTRTGAISRNEA